MVGGLTEQTGYFGAGLLMLVVVFAVTFRGTRAGWALPAVFAGVLVCALGPHVTLHGHERWRGPWLLSLEAAAAAPRPAVAVPGLRVARGGRDVRAAGRPRLAAVAGAWPLVLLALVADRCRPAPPTCGRRELPLPPLFARRPRAFGDARRQRGDGAAVVVPRPGHALADGVRLPVPAGRRVRGLARPRLLLAVPDRALVLRPAAAAQRRRGARPVPARHGHRDGPRQPTRRRTAGTSSCAPRAGASSNIGGVLVYRRT